MATKSLRRARSRRGQALVEFALVIPVFIFLVMGIFDLGRAVYANSTISNAAREGARIAIVDQTCSHITSEATRQSVALANVTVTADFRTPAGAVLATCPTTAARAIGDIATVRVNYAFTAATPFISNLLGTLNLSATSKFAIEATCVEPTDTVCPPGS
jgi:Flp pilus assembly protein TadG